MKRFLKALAFSLLCLPTAFSSATRILSFNEIINQANILSCGTDVLPDTDGARNLGSSSLRFYEADIYRQIFIGKGGGGGPAIISTPANTDSEFTIQTGAYPGTGNVSSDLSLNTGDADGGTGNLSGHTGNTVDAGSSSGNVSLTTGNSNIASGGITLQPGNTADDSANVGVITLQGGAATNTNSYGGEIDILGGGSLADGGSSGGAIVVTTASGTNSSGGLVFEAGGVGPTGTPGQIDFQSLSNNAGVINFAADLHINLSGPLVVNATSYYILSPTVSANAGVGATCTLSNTSDPNSGVITIGVGSSPSNGDFCDVAIAPGSTWSNGIPTCGLYPSNAQAAGNMQTNIIYIPKTTITSSGFSVYFGAGIAASGSYVLTYTCLGK